MLFGAAAQASCPENPNITAQLDREYVSLRFAKFEADAELITQRLWSLWFQAPDDKAQDLLVRGMGRMRAGDLAQADIILSQLITYCPNYAEGYNQRAFARYLSRDFDAALPDLERALEILPRHLGAISGKGLTLKALGFEELADVEFRKARDLNPWTPERDMIQDQSTDL